MAQGIGLTADHADYHRPDYPEDSQRNAIGQQTIPFGMPFQLKDTDWLQAFQVERCESDTRFQLGPWQCTDDTYVQNSDVESCFERSHPTAITRHLLHSIFEQKVMIHVHSACQGPKTSCISLRCHIFSTCSVHLGHFKRRNYAHKHQ